MSSTVAVQVCDVEGLGFSLFLHWCSVSGLLVFVLEYLV